MTTIDGFSGPVLTHGDPGYDEARAIWNGAIDRRPAAIARCTGAADVAAAVRYARARDMDVTVRGGGHGVGGHAVADGALMIDLSLMNGVRVDPSSRRASVDAGALLGDLDREAQAVGLVVPAGIVTHTGVAGLTLGGGLGWLMRRHGLTADNLRAADLVTADGRFLRASDQENAELFWGLRGGGGNFGIVTSFEFQAHPLGPDVLAGPLVWSLDDAGDVLRFYRDFCETAPDELTTIVALRAVPPIPTFPAELHGRLSVQVICCYAGPIAEGERAIAPLRAFGSPIADLCGPRAFLDFQRHLDPGVPHGWHYYWKSTDVDGLEDGAIDVLVSATTKLPSPRSYTLIFQLGGAVARVAEDATAYGHRTAAFTVNINGVRGEGRTDDEHVAWTRRTFDGMEPFQAGVYVNFMMEEGPDRVRAAYGASKYERLLALKRAYDPTNLFRHNQNIAP